MLHASDLQADTARKAASRPFELGHVAPVAVALRALRPGPSLRTRTVDEGHLTTLLELAGHWPPLLVHQASMTVVDGLHRFEAARRLGLELVAVLLIDRPFEEVRLIALHENVTHGLPLSILERRRAALELLAAHPTWSDGRLAELCGLSRRSIGKLRRTTTDPAKPIESTWREGRDGRHRPVRSEGLRERIAAALAEQPQASLRTIARQVGASPETVRSVRRRLGSSSSQAQPPPRPALPSADPLRARVLGLKRFSSDTACASTEPGRAFAEWFDALAVDRTALASHAQAVPLSRIYEVIDEAERRSSAWRLFAELLRARVSPS